LLVKNVSRRSVKRGNFPNSFIRKAQILIVFLSDTQGDAKNTFGTGAFMLFNTGDEPLVSQNGMVTTVGFQFGKNKPAYALEGSIASAGSAIKWTRDNLGLISSSEEIGPLGK
jgi:glycerol kinase